MSVPGLTRADPARKGAADGVLYLWLMAGMTALCAIGVLGMLLLLFRGSGPYFWPADLLTFSVVEEPGEEASLLLGSLRGSEWIPADRLRANGEEVPEGVDGIERLYIKIGNRELNGLDFTQVLASNLSRAPQRNPEVAAIERRHWGDFYGVVREIRKDGQVVASGDQVWDRLAGLLAEVQASHSRARDFERGKMADLNRRIDSTRVRLNRLKRDRESADGPAIAALLRDLDEIEDLYREAEAVLQLARTEAERYSLRVYDAYNEEEHAIQMAEVVRIYRPNSLGIVGKLSIFMQRLFEFLTAEPREANTEGGVFPAIFGTISMVLVMTLLVTPFGVLAAFYLYEYRRQGLFVRIIRICINNLAGVPSIVFGIFGLGFFVYGLGGSIDSLFFSDSLPNPTLGTPGLFWASLTLALLTLPVVVVATEEGLARVPSSLRQGALALGATKLEMLTRVVFPMALPGVLTGVILAIARAAGEVAPLMLVGAVKFAPDLPIDGHFPYIHLEQKFMHLGLHIYDAGFQSPNAEAALPLVYASSLLLVGVILVLNLGAMWLRHRYREQSRVLEA